MPSIILTATVSPHEYPRARSCAAKGSNVMSGVARALKDPKRSVAPEVHGAKPANILHGGVFCSKFQLSNRATQEGTVQDHAIRIRRVAGNVIRLEPGADNQFCAWWEDRWVSDMVYVSMRPNDVTDFGKVVPMCSERVRYVTEVFYLHDGIHGIRPPTKHGLKCGRHASEQVFHESEIEQDLLQPMSRLY